jgi:hypothetical protein
MQPSLTFVNKSQDLKIKLYLCPECGMRIRKESDVSTEIKETPCSLCLSKIDHAVRHHISTSRSSQGEYARPFGDRKTLKIQ